MTKVLVTGAAGFIGSHLAQRMVTLGHAVRAVDDFSTGRRENLAEFADQVDFHDADLADPEACRRAVEGIEVVFHLAGIPSVPRSMSEPLRTHRANVEGTFQLFESSVAAGVRRVVYSASSSVYGNTPDLPKNEQMPARPRSLYAVQKHVGELFGELYAEHYGLEVITLRYFNIFGPRQDPQSEYSAAIPKFIEMMLRGERPTIFGDGETSRDFTYVDNAVDANVLAMDARLANGAPINVACGQRFSLNVLIEKLNGILGTQLEPIYLPERQGDIRHSVADIRLAEQVLGYRPRIGFDEGLARTVTAMRARGQRPVAQA